MSLLWPNNPKGNICTPRNNIKWRQLNEFHLTNTHHGDEACHWGTVCSFQFVLIKVHSSCPLNLSLCLFCGWHTKTPSICVRGGESTIESFPKDVIDPNRSPRAWLKAMVHATDKEKLGRSWLQLRQDFTASLARGTAFRDIYLFIPQSLGQSPWTTKVNITALEVDNRQLFSFHCFELMSEDCRGHKQRN